MIHSVNDLISATSDARRKMSFDSFHSINGTEEFLGKTLFEIGIPLLHIVGGRVGMNTTYYEFAGDESEVFEELRRD